MGSGSAGPVRSGLSPQREGRGEGEMWAARVRAAGLGPRPPAGADGGAAGQAGTVGAAEREVHAQLRGRVDHARGVHAAAPARSGALGSRRTGIGAGGGARGGGGQGRCARMAEQQHLGRMSLPSALGNGLTQRVLQPWRE